MAVNPLVEYHAGTQVHRPVVGSTDCAIFDGPVADPRPNVNPGMRIVGTDTASPSCQNVKFEVAQFSDIDGPGGTMPGPRKILTAGALQDVLRVNSASFVSAVGFSSALGNTASFVSACGYQAAVSNTGNNTSANGYFAAYANTGSYVSACGHLSAFNNSGSFVSASGVAAAQENRGSNVSASGVYAAYRNTGQEVSAMGHSAARDNVASDVSAAGSSSALGNTEPNVSAMGHYAGIHNAGANCAFSGFYAGAYNKNENVSAFGVYAGAPPLISSEVRTILANTATSLVLSAPTAFPIGSLMSVQFDSSSTILNAVETEILFQVTSPTVITRYSGSGTHNPANDFGLTGLAPNQTLRLYGTGYNNTALYGNYCQATAPNQAVLGGPSQTPCGYAAFTVISDERDKAVKKTFNDENDRKNALSFIAELRPIEFCYNYETFNPVPEGGVAMGPREECSIRRMGFSAQQVEAAGSTAGLTRAQTGVRYLADEGGADRYVLDTDALIAQLVLAVQRLEARVQELEARR